MNDLDHGKCLGWRSKRPIDANESLSLKQMPVSSRSEERNCANFCMDCQLTEARTIGASGPLELTNKCLKKGCLQLVKEKKWSKW